MADSYDSMAQGLKGTQGAGICLAGFAATAAASKSKGWPQSLNQPVVIKKYGDINFGQTQFDLDVRGSLSVSDELSIS